MEDNKAKMSILKEMRKMAMDDMGKGLKSAGPMKKVTVASPTEEGLKMGLDKAEDVVKDADPQYEDESEEKLQELVDACQSAEDIDKKIAFLEKAKADKFGSEDMESEEFEEEESSNPFEGME